MANRGPKIKCPETYWRRGSIFLAHILAMEPQLTVPSSVFLRCSRARPGGNRRDSGQSEEEERARETMETKAERRSLITLGWAMSAVY